MKPGASFSFGPRSTNPLKRFSCGCSLPIDSYGMEVKEYLARDMNNIHVAINDGVRKIFGWNRWESIRELRNAFGYHSIFVVSAIMKSKFLAGFTEIRNSVLTHLLSFCIPH